jgi:hypothetical protein
MANIEDISWGSYQEYEGPFYKGKIRFELPKNPTIVDKRLATITAVESGKYDAINMYDRMIVSVGIIQWGEANNFSVTKMLGLICDSGFESIVQGCLKEAMQFSGSTFKKNQKGIWRFFIGDSEVNSLALQQKLFLGCDGRKGSWKTEEQKKYAKRWAAGIASILEDPRTRDIQKKFTIDRLMGFVSGDAKKVLFDDKTTTSWAEATRAIYLTFAINLPRIAGEMFSSTKFSGEKWSPEWCLCLIKRLTFGPNIKIYPTRYDKLRPAVERLFEIELPKNSESLWSWKPIEEKKQAQEQVEKIPTIIDEKLLEELNQIVLNKPQVVVKQPEVDSRGGILELIKSLLKKFFFKS